MRPTDVRDETPDVSALAVTRATVSDESLQEFLEDIDSIVRLRGLGSNASTLLTRR